MQPPTTESPDRFNLEMTFQFSVSLISPDRPTGFLVPTDEGHVKKISPVDFPRFCEAVLEQICSRFTYETLPVAHRDQLRVYWEQLRKRISPSVLDFQQHLFDLFGWVHPRAMRPELYDEPKLLDEILKHRGAAAQLNLIDDEDILINYLQFFPVWTDVDETWIEALKNWRQLYSHNDQDLDVVTETLNHLPDDFPANIFMMLPLVRLNDPITDPVELMYLALCEFYGFAFTEIVFPASRQGIENAMKRLNQEQGCALSTNSWDDIGTLAQLASHHPLGPALYDDLVENTSKPEE